MADNENINKLTKFCNGLGKGFRHLVEETETKTKKLQEEFVALQERVKNLEEDLILQKNLTTEVKQDQRSIAGF